MKKAQVPGIFAYIAIAIVFLIVVMFIAWYIYKGGIAAIAGKP